MQDNNILFQKDFFSMLNVNLLICEYTHCPETWREIDYIPDFNKFYLILEGEGWLKIGGREYYPKPGQLVMMPSGVQQSYSTISKNTFTKYWCHFSAKVGDINLFDIINTPYYIDCMDLNRIKTLFADLLQAQNNQQLYARLKEKALLTEVVAYFIENCPREIYAKPEMTSMKKLNGILKYIQEHLNESITVEKLAEQLHFHPNYFSKVFKKYIGTSPVQYIHRKRLEKAKNLLRATELHISEIASEMGFCDIYHFSNSFKKLTGFSPREYRNLK